jgi:hypothetical protein
MSSRVREADGSVRPEDARSRFAPAEGIAFFELFGWREDAYLDLFLESSNLGRNVFFGRSLLWIFPHLPEKLRASLERRLGVVRLRPLK